MRIAISALVGMALTFASAIALAANPQAGGAPPPPPPPGSLPPPEPPPPIPSPFPPGDAGESRGRDIAGFRDGFYVRDPRDYFHLFPSALLQIDTYGFAGPGVTGVPANAGGVELKTRLFFRRARLRVGGEFLRRWSFMFSTDFGGQTITNTNGLSELTAAPPGQAPTAATGRYAPVEGVAGGASLGDAWINYSVCPCLNLMVGQMNVPFSMENRTLDDFTPWMERNLAIRGFAAPFSKDLGGVLWGELGPKVFNYELGVFGGDGQNRPSVDNRVDFVGRLFARPFAGGGTSAIARSAQIGVSARHGDRDPKSVAYDYPAITTGQGFVLWRPAYVDGLGRLVHVLPSGAQNSIGGELRARLERFAVQGEAYYVHNNTREAVDGYQLTNTERLGRVKGVGWYAQLSAWPLGDSFFTPEPGMYRPRTLDLSKPAPDHMPRGLELLAIAGGINAHYDGAIRKESHKDAKTPRSDVTVYQFGLGAQYWHTKHVRVAFNYIAYLAPGSGTASNQVLMPDNLTKAENGKAGTGHLLHEFGGRLQLSF